MMTKLEIKKVFNNRKNRLLIIAAFLGAIVFSIFAIHSFRFVDANDNITTGISSPRLLIEEKNKWKGEITPDTLSEIIKAYKNGEWQSTYDIIFSASRMLKGDPVENLEGNEISKATLNEINSFYEIYRKNLDLESKDNGDTSKQIDFLQKQYQKIKTPFYYEAADSWETMFLYATTYSLILIIITSFLTSGIFSEEFKYNTFLVFFSTKYGKSKCVKCKIYAGLIVTSLVYWIGISLLSIICFGVMGTSGSSTLYQVYSPFSMYVVSMRGLYTIIVLSGYVACLLSGAVSMLIATIFKSSSLAIGFSFVLFFVSPFIGRALPFRTFFSLTPDQLTNVMNSVRIPYIYQVGNIVFKQIPFIFIFYTCISMLMLPLIYIKYKNSMNTMRRWWLAIKER